MARATSARRASIACTMRAWDSACASATWVMPAMQLLLAVVQRPHRAVEVHEVARERLDRPGRARGGAQQQEREDDGGRGGPQPRVVEGDLRRCRW